MTGSALLIRNRSCPGWMGDLVAGITGYSERSGKASVQSEPASLVVPLIISFRSGFTISLSTGPDGGEECTDFVAGLTSGPVWIGSTGDSECIQIDFTPLGARAFLGLPLSEIVTRLVPADALLGPQVRQLRDDLCATDNWQVRFALVERYLHGRFTHAPSPLVAAAWRCMVRAGPCLRVERLAAELDVSRKHLSRQFRHEIGLRPKTVSRILRFQRSLRMAHLAGKRADLADIAAASGYADQAHMTREFQSLGGMSPRALICQ